jgi:O-glycosyl hydrolase
MFFSTRHFVLMIAALATGSTWAQSNQRARITVNPAERFQFIQGFGVNFTGPYFRDDQKPMFDMLIKDLGASMFRVVPYLVYSNWE